MDESRNATSLEGQSSAEEREDNRSPELDQGATLAESVADQTGDSASSQSVELPPPNEPPAADAPSGDAAEDEGEMAGIDSTTHRDGAMEKLMSDVAQEYRLPQRGEVVDGVIVRIDRDGVLVDIGTKSEGLIPSQETQQLIDAGDVAVGDQVLVYVLHSENQDGHAILSLNRARSERSWRAMQRGFEEGEVFEAEVVDFNKGGLIVDADGVQGFVPLSQIASVRLNGANDEDVRNRLSQLVGQRICLKVLEVNRRRNRLILSERQALQVQRSQRKEQLVSELREGETRRGRVSSLCDFGAFVDVGGADGLVHLSELSWRQVNHPREVLSVGEEVDVCVLGVDRDKKKIALSIRRLQPEPWTAIAEKYHPGDLVEATVTKLATFGAFARVEDGVEGLIHISELADGHVAHPRNVVKEGDVVSLRVLRVDPSRRRLALSLKQVEDSGEVEQT